MQINVHTHTQIMITLHLENERKERAVQGGRKNKGVWVLIHSFHNFKLDNAQVDG